jgi:hypothetical protein
MHVKFHTVKRKVVKFHTLRAAENALPCPDAQRAGPNRASNSCGYLGA